MDGLAYIAISSHQVFWLIGFKDDGDSLASWKRNKDILAT